MVAENLDDLVRLGTATKEVGVFLAACVEGGINILVSGGTASGKTTTLNALGRAIPEGERLVTIEETAELKLEDFLTDCVALEARSANIEGAGHVSIRDLVRHALRMRPTRIIVGEVRGPEALDMLSAMNTGHEGSMGTIHANSARQALSKLRTYVLMAEEQLSAEVATEMIADTINLVVHLQLDQRAGVRRVVQVAEVASIEGGRVLANDLFQLGKLRPLHIQALESRALEKGRADGRGGLAPRSVVHIHRVLSQALGQAVRWQLLPANPAQAVQPPRPGRPELHIPDPDTIERIVRGAEGTHLYAPIVLAVATGMRRSEILGLRWSVLNLDEGLARIVATLHRTSDGLMFTDPKTQRSRRTVVLPPLAIDVLRKHRKQQTERRLKLGNAWREHDLVVTVIDGGPMEPGELTRGFKAIATKVGASDVRFHDLRHAFATMLLASGVHPKVASEALGHSTVGITLDIYAGRGSARHSGDTEGTPSEDRW